MGLGGVAATIYAGQGGHFLNDKETFGQSPEMLPVTSKEKSFLGRE